jgi:hypothetical protein
MEDATKKPLRMLCACVSQELPVHIRRNVIYVSGIPIRENASKPTVTLIPLMLLGFSGPKASGLL